MEMAGFEMTDDFVPSWLCDYLPSGRRRLPIHPFTRGFWAWLDGAA
jgi:hypothetical protein